MVRTSWLYRPSTVLAFALHMFGGVAESGRTGHVGALGIKSRGIGMGLPVMYFGLGPGKANVFPVRRQLDPHLLTHPFHDLGDCFNLAVSESRTVSMASS